MALEISESIAKTLPSSVKTSLGQMSAEQQSIFEEEYKKKMKIPSLFQILAIFGLHYFFLGRVGLAILYWLTLGGLLWWWLIDIFRIRGVVMKINEETAKTIVRDMKIMSMK